MTEEQALGEGFSEALSALREAFDRAARAVEGMPSGRQAFESATELADLLRTQAERAADLRSLTAARIAEDESLSLAGLANRISVSKARAGQLVQGAKKIRQQQEAAKGDHDA